MTGSRARPCRHPIKSWRAATPTTACPTSSTTHSPQPSHRRRGDQRCPEPPTTSENTPLDILRPFRNDNCSLQQRDLMAQGKDLRILVPIAHRQQVQRGERVHHAQVGQSHPTHPLPPGRMRQGQRSPGRAGGACGARGVRTGRLGRHRMLLAGRPCGLALIRMCARKARWRAGPGGDSLRWHGTERALRPGWRAVAGGRR